MRGASGLVDKAPTLEEVEYLIPWGTQTNGKRVPPEFRSVSPSFVERAEGCRFLATNGRWYLDFRSALGPIILGYNYPTVVDAVRKQLDRGVLFSLASPVEYELAARFVDTLPGVEQVRFLKSGNEANLAALRLARAYTGRDHVVACGYHGHGDVFSAGVHPPGSAGFAREGNGVPQVLDELISWVSYGDVEAIEAIFDARGDSVAAVIMVPYDWREETTGDFTRAVEDLTRKHGTVLVHDEVLTGFRLAYGGARTWFGVEPDLTIYGKAVANGFPLSVLCGHRDLMRMFDRVTITTTHAGETLSIAAALATMTVLESESSYDGLRAIGSRWMEGFNTVCRRSGVPARLVGLPVAPHLQIGGTDNEQRRIRRALYAGLLERGIFPSDLSLMTLAHAADDIDEATDAVDQTLRSLGA